MIRYARLTIKDTNPMSSASDYHIRTAANKVVKQCKPGFRYYVVGGLHGDKPNGNGDFFAYEAELLQLLNGREIFAAEEVDNDEYGQPIHMYETWRGRGSYINHKSYPRNWNNKNRVGTIIDVYPDHADKCIDFLVEVEEKRAPWLVQAIDDGQITDTSMGVYCQYSTCVVPGTMITMGDGTFKPIEDIKIGDYVLTHTGNVHKVTGTIINDVDEDIYRIKSSLTYGSLCITGNHPIWTTRRDNIMCKKNHNKNQICRSEGCTVSNWHNGKRYKPLCRDNGKDKSFSFVPVNEVNAGDYVESPVLQKNNPNGISTSLSRLIGYYLSEGCIRKGYSKNFNGVPVGLDFAISRDEMDTVGRDIADVCNSFGIHTASIIKRHSTNDRAEVKYTNHGLAEYLLQNCGKGARNKKISGELFNQLSNDNIKHIIGTFMDGDGCNQRIQGMRMSTASESLAAQLHTMCRMIGMRSRIRKATQKGGPTNREKECTIYNVTIPDYDADMLLGYSRKATNSSGKKIHHGFWGDYGLDEPIKSIEKIHYSGPVYNLSVDVDESYVANGISVHNCSHCGKLILDESDQCECIKTRKGRKCPDYPNGTCRCHEHGGIVFEDNHECTGIEDSWIVAGRGADPDAKHKYTLASEEEPMKSVTRSAGVGGASGSNALSKEEIAEAMGIKRAAESGAPTDDMTRMAQALGADKLRELGLSPESFGIEEADIDQQIIEAEQQQQVEKQVPVVTAQACENRIAEIDRTLANIVSQKQRAEALKTDTGKSILARLEVTQSDLVKERAALAQEVGKFAAQSEQVNEMTKDDVEKIVRQVLAQAVPSPSAQTGTGGEGYSASTDPASMIDPEKIGKTHQVEPQMTNEDLGRVSPNDISVPSPGMKNPTTEYSASTDPASMIDPEKIGKSHDVKLPGITQADLQNAIVTAIATFAQQMGIPTESVSEEGDKQYNVNSDPANMIKPEKLGDSHTGEMPTSSQDNSATDPAFPTPSKKSDEDGDKEYSASTDPTSMIDPEKFGKNHDIKPAVEAKAKRPACDKCGTDLVFGKCPKCKTKKALNAKFVPDDNFTNSAWMVFDGEQLKMKVSALDAYPTDTKENYEWFSSTKYGNILVNEIAKSDFGNVARLIHAQLFDDGPSGDKKPPFGGDDKKNPFGDDKKGDIDGSKPANPSPEVSDKLNGDTKSGPNTEDILIGVFAALISDKEATVDEIKATLEKMKDPGAFDKFIGRLEQEINDNDDSKSDVKKELGDDKKPPFGGGDKKPPFGGGKPEGKIESDTIGKAPDEKGPITAQLKEPKEEDARAYFLTIYPADFVEGLFAGSPKAVVAALKTIEKITKTNQQLLDERTKIIQAKRVETLLESMYKKGALRTIDDVMREDGVLEPEAKRVVTAEFADKKIELLAMNEEAFSQYASTIEGMRDRSDIKVKSASMNGFRMIPDIKSGSDPRMVIASQDEDEMDGLFSMPPAITENDNYISTHKSGERAAKDQIRQAQFKTTDMQDNDLLGAFAESLDGSTVDELDDEE